MEKQKPFYGWWIVAGCFLLTFAGIGIAINCISVFFKPVVESLGFARGDFSLYFTIAALSMMLAAPFMGKLLSKYDLKIVMGISTTIVTISFILYSQCTTLAQFYICSVFLGIGSAGTHVIPVALLITNWFKEKRGLALGIALAGSGIGGFLFNPLTNWLILNHGWETAYVVLGCILGLCTIPVALFVVKIHPSTMGLKPYGEILGGTISSMEDLKGLTTGEAVRTAGFWVLALALLLIGVMNMGIQMHVPAYLTDVGYTPTFAANIVAMFMGILVIGKIALGSVFDRFGLKVGIIFIYSVFAAAALILIGAKAMWVVILFGLVFGFANAIMTVPAPYITAELFGQKNYGVIYGIMTIFFTLGSGIGMPLSGYIFDATGSYVPAFTIYIGLALGGMVLALISVTLGKKAYAQIVE